MTPDERNLLNDLADKIAKTPPPPKDPEAEEFIRTRIGSRPDALYLMTQTVLIQNLALQHAQQQIQELQQRAGQPAPIPGGSSSFLGQGGAQQSPRPGPNWGAQQQGPAQPPAPQYMPPSPSAPSPGGAPSFLRGAAQTAAGVAAGALAFEGIRSLFSHPGYGGGFLGGGGFMGGGAPVEETVVNNYYDNPGDSSTGDYADYRAEDQQAGDYQNAGDDGQLDDSAQYQDAGYDTGDDGGGFDDNSGGGDFA